MADFWKQTGVKLSTLKKLFFGRKYEQFFSLIEKSLRPYRHLTDEVDLSAYKKEAVNLILQTRLKSEQHFPVKAILCEIELWSWPDDSTFEFTACPEKPKAPDFDTDEIFEEINPRIFAGEFELEVEEFVVSKPENLQKTYHRLFDDDYTEENDLAEEALDLLMLEKIYLFFRDVKSELEKNPAWKKLPIFVLSHDDMPLIF